MDINDINNLLAQAGHITPELEARVNIKLAETMDVFHRAYPNQEFSTPNMVYDLKGHTAGYAIGGHTIRLNAGILGNPKHTEDMLHQTLPHEVAHIIVQQLYPGAQGHGREWRNMMRLLKLRPDRCHQYDTVAARKKSKPYKYHCGCSEHMVSITIHRRILQGRQYRCRQCGYVLRKV